MNQAPEAIDWSAPTATNWSQRRVLITGATGIVGSWLCQELIAQRSAVVALVRDDDPQARFFRERIDDGVAVVSGDLTSIRDCQRAVNDFEADTIFHLGAQTIVGAALRDPLACFESNIRGTYNILETARRFGSLVRCVIVASSDKAYGASDQLPYREDMPLRGRHPYDVSKSCADLLSDTYANTYGLPVAIARCGNIFGGGDLNWSRIVPGTIRSLLAGERPLLRSTGRTTRDYLYVLDAVRAYMLLAERIGDAHVRGAAYNFGPQRPISVLQMVAAIAEVLGVQADPIILATATHEIPDQSLDSSKARASLGWSIQWPLEQGLRETVAWYRTYLAPSIEAHAR